MSESSYNEASKAHQAEGSTGANDSAFNRSRLEPEDVLMPAEEFPIGSFDEEYSLKDSAEIESATRDASESVEPIAAKQFFSAVNHKKKAHVAKSFSNEFIENSDPLTDEDHFIAYQQGDDKAFFILYERYRSSVYAYCARVLLSAGLSQELVEDTFQEIFLRVSQYRNSFHSGEFRAWIFTVTRNTCLSAKKRGLKSLLSSNGMIDPDQLSEEEALSRSSSVERTDDPLELLSVKEQTSLLLKAISELPDTYREALMLSEYEGLTYEEIGKLTGTSLSTIRIRVFRAKKRLRKVLYPILGQDFSTGASATADLEESEEV